MPRYTFRFGQEHDAISYTATVDHVTPWAAAAALQEHMQTRSYAGMLLAQHPYGLHTDLSIWRRGDDDTDGTYPVVLILVHITPALISADGLQLIDGQPVPDDSDAPCLCGARMIGEGFCEVIGCVVNARERFRRRPITIRVDRRIVHYLPYGAGNTMCGLPMTSALSSSSDLAAVECPDCRAEIPTRNPASTPLADDPTECAGCGRNPYKNCICGG